MKSGERCAWGKVCGQGLEASISESATLPSPVYSLTQKLPT